MRSSSRSPRDGSPLPGMWGTAAGDTDHSGVYLEMREKEDLRGTSGKTGDRDLTRDSGRVDPSCRLNQGEGSVAMVSIIKRGDRGCDLRNELEISHRSLFLRFQGGGGGGGVV